jgi:hypothetical protein
VIPKCMVRLSQKSLKPGRKEVEKIKLKKVK